VVCAPSAEEIAAAIRGVLETQGDDWPADRPAAHEGWLTEHGWDFAADQVAQVLGI
jgi:hypothetical protein